MAHEFSKSRGLKNRAILNNNVKIEYKDTLKKLSDGTRLPQSVLLDEALELLFKKHGIEVKRRPGRPRKNT